MSFFVAGASVAASPRFGGSETDVFSVGATGQIGVSWVTGAGAWNQPLPLTPINTFLPGGASGGEPAIRYSGAANGRICR